MQDAIHRIHRALDALDAGRRATRDLWLNEGADTCKRLAPFLRGVTAANLLRLRDDPKNSIPVRAYAEGFILTYLARFQDTTSTGEQTT